MKKLLFSAVSALALAGVATAADSTQFGVLTVESKAARTLVAIPWGASEAAGGEIAVSNVVLTSNLSMNDTLNVIDDDGSTVNYFYLTNTPPSEVLYWKQAEKSATKDGVDTPKDSTEVKIDRGSAVILRRNNPVDGSGKAIPFYVMGQVASDEPSTTIKAGTSSSPCYNMIAPPSTVAQYLYDVEGTGKHCATWTGTIGDGDRIYLNLDNGWTPEIKYVEGVWKIRGAEVVKGIVKTTWTPYNTAIPVGTGFWYVSKGGNPTVTWDDVPTVTK